MKTESIFGRANLVTNLTNVTWTVDMLGLNVILQTLFDFALVFTHKALEYSTIKTSHQGGYFSIQSPYVGYLKLT